MDALGMSSYRRDYDVDIFTLFHEKGHFRLDEFLRHDFRVASTATTLFLHRYFNKLRTE